MGFESFSQQPLQQVIPAYLYAQYSDDETLQAFVDAYNGIAQGYLDWDNSTPLSVYTNPSISGALLDWIGTGVYGIGRPTLSTETDQTFGEYDSTAWNTIAFSNLENVFSGSVQVANDDIYKRFMTWVLYRGDGVQMTMQWLKRRVARFIYGAYGSDISVDVLQNISIVNTGSSNGASAGTNSGPTNGGPTNGITALASTAHSGVFNITIQSGYPSSTFAMLVKFGVLPLPFQCNFEVTIA